MKKNTINTALLITLITLFSGCSEMRYAHLKKINVSRNSENKTFSSNRKSNQHLVNTVASFENIIAERGDTNKPLATEAKINQSNTTASPVLGDQSHNFGKIKHANAIKKKTAIAPHDHLIHGGLLWTIVMVLLVLWLLSLLTGGWGLGGLIYLFLVVALIVILLRLLGIL